MDSSRGADVDETEKFVGDEGAVGGRVKLSDDEAEQQGEGRAVGSVDWRVYWRYVASMGSFCHILLLFLFIVAVQLLFNFTDLWLSVWANEAERRHFESQNNESATTLLANESGDDLVTTSLSPNVRDNMAVFKELSLDDLMYIYIAAVALLMGLSVLRVLWCRLTQTVASVTLHDKMFRSVVTAETVFFDANSVGRVLNRFAKDTGRMDDQLAFVFYDFLQGTLQFCGVVILMGILNVYLFIPIVPLCLVFLYARHFYLQTFRQLKRLEAVSRSPLFSHVSSTLNGLNTIRAFANQKMMLSRFYEYLNVNTSAFRLTFSSARWFAMMIDYVVALYITCVAFSCVFVGADDLKSGQVGLMLVYTLMFPGYFSWILRQSTELEALMVSVERIDEYGKLPSEEPRFYSRKGREPSTNWPQNGKIVLENVSLRYSEAGGCVISNISATIIPGEKVGLVGRTGAGKSSLLKILFRLVEYEGTIRIDDVDCKAIGLHDLRKALSIIPQDPVLFIGTMRKNLDPFDEYSDEQLYSALEQVELKESLVLEGKSALDATIQEGGSNLSVGQRQLVCLARALLKQTKVLVVDEATANVDPNTDALIQRTLRKSFANCTVITIAHRLNTIMDSDRIMVLEKGQVKQFDSPAVLLSAEHEQGLFSQFVNETGDENASYLRRLAKNAEELKRTQK